ncbi:hemolysin family protein [Tepidamorphus sp. 3E244]|uniref:hemolysin family protein n=1 Tax=Tepidamorphus sp. 3E244 TaxID=3385498 RepID=UPI0038FC5B07
MTHSDKIVESSGADAGGSEAKPASSANLPVVYAPKRRRFFVDWLKNLLGVGGQDNVRASISDALEADDTGTDFLTAEERLMLRNVLELRELRVDDVMVPRADIVSVDIESKLGEVLTVFQEAGHSRLPVVRETLDEPVGFVHIKDVLAQMTREAMGRRKGGKITSAESSQIDLSKVRLDKTLSSAKLTREVLFVPPSMPAGDLLAKMQATRLHMAVVVDEYGGTDGLATIEDLVEEIVGDIEDEHDDANGPMLVPTGDGVFAADARMPLDELQEAIGADLAFSEDLLEEVDTLGGLVFSQLGRVPVRGELVGIGGDYEIEVIEADPRRIKRVRIQKRKTAEARRKQTSQGAAAAE